MFLPADDDAAAKVDELDRKRRDLKMSGEGATLFEARAYVMEQEIQSLTDPLGGFQIVEWLAERDLAFPVIITTAALVTDDVLDFEMRWGHSRLVAESYLRYISKPLPYSAFLSLIESLLAD
jgi:hypothetical protein